MTEQVSTDYLSSSLQSARQRTLELIDGLTQDQLVGPKLPTLNPMIWEIGHVGWFYESFILRKEYGHEPLLARGDQLYDSIAIAHDTRWDLPVYSLVEITDYMTRILDTLIARLGDGMADERDSYLYQFTTFHEDMHDEAFTWARQTLAYPTPTFASDGPWRDRMPAAGSLDGDAVIPGGVFRLGAGQGDAFVFDNEKWAHEHVVAPFAMARAPVTNRQFAEFVDDGGYDVASLWSAEGWTWRQTQQRAHPAYWRWDASDGWKLRRFEHWHDLAPDEPVVHVNWYEANAWCGWAGRRLPTEAEWEFAATMRLSSEGGLQKANYPWGDEAVSPERANMDGFALKCADVADYAAGDNAWGCRQLLGNVWEWTADTFAPFSGFAPDDYKEYSQPLFGNTKVLRGGSWVTRSRYMDSKYRNFFGPERCDIFAGFRTCAGT